METKKMKVYNVIILDKSGSMSSIARQALDGVNETIGSIKSAQEKNPDQEHIVTLVAFCGCELKSIYDNTPVAEVKTLTDRDYRPCCMTPLYDAIGTTISRVHSLKSQDPESLALVTIITDGYENASRKYDGASIKTIVDRLSEKGWTFAYIGANQDAIEVAGHMGIENAMNFKSDKEGTREMWRRERRSRVMYYERSRRYGTAKERLKEGYFSEE